MTSTAPTPPELAKPLLPHTPLAAYYADESEHQRFLRQIFDDTAYDYDRIEAILALGSGPWYRRVALTRAGLAQGMDVVDVGVGTGLLARQALTLIGPKGKLIGVDPSPGMMAQARLPEAQLLQGRAESLPCADASADFLSMGYALRHVSDVDASFAEFHRVLRPGGRLVVLEITSPQSRLAVSLLKLYMRVLVPAIAKVVARRAESARLWRFYWDTIDACMAPADVMAALQRAGFTQVKRHLELGIFSEYSAVRPE